MISCSVGTMGERIFGPAENLPIPIRDGSKEYFTRMEKQGFDLVFEETLFENFKIGHATIDAQKETFLALETLENTVQICYMLQGRSLVTANLNAYSFNGNECNIMFRPATRGSIQLERGISEMILIDFKTNFFIDYLPMHDWFVPFRNLISNKETGRLFRENRPITPKLHFLINEILQYPWEGHLKKIHIHAKIMELLLEHMDTYRPSQYKKQGLQPITRDKMKKVMECIVSEYKHPPSLKQLANKVGTNEYDLKKDFKAIYGTTVFGYISELRMEKAKLLLEENLLSIGQISDKVGYRNPQHFSTAFKRKFGVSPSTIRK